MSDDAHSRKKRGNTKQIIKDEYREDDDDDNGADEPKFDGSFERASAEEMSKRKIFKLKAKNKPAAQIPDEKKSSPSTTSPTAASAAAAESTNPFSSISFNFSQPPVITSGMFSTNSSGLFGTSSLSSSTNTLFENLKQQNETNKNGTVNNTNQTSITSLIPPSSGRFKTAPSPTLASTPTSSLFPPLNNNNNTSSSLFPPLNGSNSNSSTGYVFAPLIPATTDEKKDTIKPATTATTATTSSGFTFNAFAPESTSIKPTASTGFIFNSTAPESTSIKPTATTGFIFNSAQESTSIKPTASTGFVFDQSASLKPAVASPPADGNDKWKCACCETANPASEKSCTVCMVPRLVPKAEKWKCACCETENEANAKSCSICMVPKLDKPAKSSNSSSSSSSLSSSSLFSGVVSSGIKFGDSDNGNVGGGIKFGTTDISSETGGFKFGTPIDSNVSTSAPSNGGFKFGTPIDSNVSTSAPSSGFVFNAGASTSVPASSGGFVFSSNSSKSSLFDTMPGSSNKAAAELPDGKWKCACCEKINEAKDLSCDLCMVPRAK